MQQAVVFKRHVSKYIHVVAGSISNKAHNQCMYKHKNRENSATQAASLPKTARLPINRCNVPAVILGSLIFQRNPVPIYIDGVHELHKHLFSALDNYSSREQRAEYFMNYLAVQFRFEHPEDTGLDMDSSKTGKRHKADYLRTLRGWLFDPNGQEAAVMKSWVESRFGLLTRYHNGPLYASSGNNAKTHRYNDFLESRARGLYATNALESQLDLLYSYCQYELARTCSPDLQARLYRGVNRPYEYEVLEQRARNHAVFLLNNLNSFTRNRDRAGEFGDYILEVSACWQKIVFYSDLLPGHLLGEEEVLLIGGVYEVDISR